jgi:hypothetical protein
MLSKLEAKKLKVTIICLSFLYILSINKMNATVTSLHHFCKGIELTIHNGKLKWKIKKDNIKTLDPANSLDDFIESIIFAFIFTGISECIKSEDITVGSIIKCIYNTALEQKVKFIRIGRCGCNMGHCSAVLSAKVDDNEYKTYGDVMTLFGCEYPDSVWLTLERITEIPEIHEDENCYKPKILATEKLDPNIIYLAWGWTR